MIVKLKGSFTKPDPTKLPLQSIASVSVAYLIFGSVFVTLYEESSLKKKKKEAKGSGVPPWRCLEESRVFACSAKISLEEGYSLQKPLERRGVKGREEGGREGEGNSAAAFGLFLGIADFYSPYFLFLLFPSD